MFFGVLAAISAFISSPATCEIPVNNRATILQQGISPREVIENALYVCIDGEIYKTEYTNGTGVSGETLPCFNEWCPFANNVGIPENNAHEPGFLLKKGDVVRHAVSFCSKECLKNCFKEKE